MDRSSVVINRIKLIIIAFFASIGGMYQYGYSTTILLTAKDATTEFLNESYYDENHEYFQDATYNLIWQLTFNSFPFGFLIGLLFCPFCVEKIGRKPLLLLTMVFDVVATVVQAIAFPLNCPPVFGVGRTILGVGSGLSCIALTLFLQEVAPTKIRGGISTIQAASVKYLALFGMLVAMPKALGTLDQLPYLMCVGVLSLFWKSMLFFCPETPKFLLLNKKDENRARDAIVFYQGKEADVDRIITEIRRENVCYHEFDEENLDRTNPWSKIMDGIKQPPFIRAVVLGIVTFVAFNFAGYIAFSQNLPKMLDQFHYLDHTAIVVTAGVFRIFSSFASIVAMVTVERISRRKVLIRGLSIVTVLLILLSLCFIISQYTSSEVFGYAAIVILLLHTIFYSVFPYTISWYITAELVPQPLRSTALSIAQIFNLFCHYIVGYLFLPIFDALQGYTFLVLFVIPTSLCIVYLYFKLPETRNREVADIVNELSDNKKVVPIMIANHSVKDKF